LAVNYDNSLIREVNTVYDSTSFIGNSEAVFARKKLLTEEGQVAYAITRTNQNGVNGSGNIAEFAFILELDIIVGRSESVLELDIIDLIVVDSSGREIPVTIPDDAPAVTVIIDENSLVNTEEQLLNFRTKSSGTVYLQSSNNFSCFGFRYWCLLGENSYRRWSWNKRDYR